MADMIVGGGFNQADVRRLLGKLDRLPPDVEKEILVALARSAELVRTDAIRSIKRISPSSGPQTRYDPKRVVTPALRENPPNWDTGILAGNIVTERIPNKIAFWVKSKAFYSKFLEFGFRDVNGQRHGPWPFLFPAFERNKKAIQKIIAAGVTRALELASRR